MAAGSGVFGPYKHRERYRVLVRAVSGGAASYTSFATEEQALAFFEIARAELDRSARSVGEAIDAYVEHLLESKGNKPAGLATTRVRLRQLCAPHLDELIEALTPAICRKLYTALTRTKATRSGPGGERVETDHVLSVDTCRNTVAQAKSFGRWCATQRWLRANPFDGIEPVGKRRHGKPQLRIDEARLWMACALDLAAKGDVGAIGALLTLILGLRASEIIERVVRDLDDDGHLLWIPDSKTEAGKRKLELPDLLRPHLLRLVAGKAPTELLFGPHWRDWPRKSVRRICQLAGVPQVTAHGMRGLHSTLAIEAGSTSHVVARSLGHENISTTLRSYARRGARENAQQRATLKVLAGGKRRSPG